MATINLSELEDAMTLVGDPNGAVKAWVARDTGIVHLRNDEYMDDEAPLPADVEDDERYVPVPDIKKLDLGRELVFRFAATRMPGDEHAIREFFRKPGAYSRFSNLLGKRGETDAWHRFRDEETRAALRSWCEAHDLHPEN